MGTKNKTHPSSTVPQLSLRAESRMAENGNVSEEVIRQRAQEIYRSRLSEGRPGDATWDWLEAERQLRERAATAGQ